MNKVCYLLVVSEGQATQEFQLMLSSIFPLYFTRIHTRKLRCYPSSQGHYRCRPDAAMKDVILGICRFLERREGTSQRTPEFQASPQIKMSHAKMDSLRNISTTSARVLSGVPNTEKQMKARGRFGRVLLLFQGVWNA